MCENNYFYLQLQKPCNACVEKPKHCNELYLGWHGSKPQSMVSLNTNYSSQQTTMIIRCQIRQSTFRYANSVF